MEPHVYDDRPDAEVEVDGHWYAAEIRMRLLREDGWWFNCSWHRDGDTFLDNFPANRVRADEVDRSRGRDVGGAT